jgi:predicted metal-binding protein
LTLFRIRAQDLVAKLSKVAIEENEGEIMPVQDVEVQYCAAVIAVAFLNPGK